VQDPVIPEVTVSDVK